MNRKFHDKVTEIADRIAAGEASDDVVMDAIDLACSDIRGPATMAALAYVVAQRNARDIADIARKVLELDNRTKGDW